MASARRCSKVSAEIRVALKLELLLGVRIGEALGALRPEIDFKQRVWTIPAHRTKANREHKLPLSDFTLELLGAANERAGKSILFFLHQWTASQSEDARQRGL
jgi:integrase